MSLLMIFLTIIAGFVALGFVASFVLAIGVTIKKRREDKAYKERVDKAMNDLSEQGLLPKSKEKVEC